VFDVEGVIIPKRRYLLFEAPRRVTTLKFIRMLLAGLLYEAGLTQLETALRKIYKQLRGLSESDLLQLFKRIPLLPNVETVFRELKQAGCKLALISSGLPQTFIDDLSHRLNCDYAFGLELETVEGKFTGQISGDVIKPGGKAFVLKRIMEHEGLTTHDCALIADDRNNLPMFKLCHTRIGYNPDFVLAHKSDIVIKGDLSEALPTLTGYSRPKPHSISARDLFRETIHISGFLVALFTKVFTLDIFWVSFVIFMVTLAYVISELSRMFGVNTPLASTITWNAALQPEIYEFVTAPIFFAFGIMLSLLLFPPAIGYASIAVFTSGDGFATIFGKTIGKHVIPYNKGKKIEGTVFGFILASLGALVFVSPSKALVGAAAAMIIETLPSPINDNLTMPLIAGLAMLIMP
jgi:HAD superfamily phosphoserine phosphatase-like hydrolase